MKSVLKRAARPLRFIGVVAIAASAIGLLGLFRLWQQFPGAASSPGLLIPFLWPVLSLALEAAVLVAVSVSASMAREGGSALLPSSSPRARLLALLVALATVVAVAELVPRGSERPGAFANQLLRRARAGCGSGSTRSVTVPLIGLNVRCGGPSPRIEGPMPGASFVRVSMAEVSFSDDLRRVNVVGLELSARGSLQVQIRAGRATVTGLAPWTRSASLSPLSRFGVVFGTGLGIALLTMLFDSTKTLNGSYSVEARNGAWARRWLGSALGALPGVAAAAVLIALDQARTSASAYVLPLLAALVTLGFGAGLAALLPKMLKRFKGF